MIVELLITVGIPVLGMGLGSILFSCFHQLRLTWSCAFKNMLLRAIGLTLSRTLVVGLPL